MTASYTDAQLESFMADRESDLVERKESFSDFDALPVPSASIADLDLRRFDEEYLPLAVDAATLAANDRSIEERLAATKMIVSVDDPTPTIAGILVLGKRPQDYLPGAYAQFLRVGGTDLSDPIMDEARGDGPVANVIQRLDDKIRAHIHTAVDITSGTKEIRTPDYPLTALQQLVRNAVMHRTYEGTNSPIHVYWFDDRIEITSPGGPYGAVTADNFGRPGLVDYRNPILAEAMRVLGLVQRYGAGIPIARRALLANDQPEPEFGVEANWVHCTVKVRA